MRIPTSQATQAPSSDVVAPTIAAAVPLRHSDRACSLARPTNAMTSRSPTQFPACSIACSFACRPDCPLVRLPTHSLARPAVRRISRPHSHRHLCMALSGACVGPHRHACLPPCSPTLCFPLTCPLAARVPWCTTTARALTRALLRPHLPHIYPHASCSAYAPVCAPARRSACMLPYALPLTYIPARIHACTHGLFSH